jgi:NADPH:quinone reductase-like Zn-dependent oxidoreductase
MTRTTIQARLMAALTPMLLSAAVLAAALPAIPEQMRTIKELGYGGPEMLQVTTVAVPKPDAGQVLIQVYAAGINPVDWKRRTGQFANQQRGAGGGGGAGGGMAARGPGGDIAGVVVALGEGVTNWQLGDAVFGSVASGAGYAEYAVANANGLTRKPVTFSYQQAAGIPTAGSAALRVIAPLTIKPGQRVLVIGAAGGVGSTVVQLLRARGAVLIASASSKHNAFLAKLGVKEVINYDKVKVIDSVRNIDVVVNTVDGENDAAISYVKKGGTVVSIAGRLDSAKCEAAGVTCPGGAGPGRGGPGGDQNGSQFSELVALAEAGKYTINIEKAFPLEKAGEAQEQNRTGHTEGKIVLAIHANSDRR